MVASRAFYTVLMEGDDQQDPIVDAVRSLLDGHVVVVANDGGKRMVSAGKCAGFFEPVDACGDWARPQNASVHSEKTLGSSCAGRRISFASVRIGLGQDEDLDRAMRAMPSLREFLEQRSDECTTIQESVARLSALKI